MCPTPHNRANKGDYAPVCIMPGDPLRAKYIAEKFLDSARLVNDVRNCLGFSGTYKGHEVSVQASGMGIPSFSIYAQELVEQYGVKRIIRSGTCGSIAKQCHVRDIILAEGSSTDSVVVQANFGEHVHFAPIATFSLLDACYHKALALGHTVHVGDLFSTDLFYNDDLDYEKLSRYGVLALDMESAGLYVLAAKFGFEALTISSVSDSILFDEPALTSQEREQTVDDLCELALETAIS